MEYFCYELNSNPISPPPPHPHFERPNYSCICPQRCYLCVKRKRELVKLLSHAKKCQNQNQNDFIFKVNSCIYSQEKLLWFQCSYFPFVQSFHRFIRNKFFTFSLKAIRLRLSQSRLIWLFKTVILFTITFLPTLSFIIHCTVFD